MSQEKISEIGEEVSSAVAIDSLSRQVAGDDSPSFESTMKMMKLGASASAFEMTETTHGKQKVVILYHNISRNYSLFLGSCWKALFAKAGVDTTFTMDDDAVVFKFHDHVR